MLVAQLVGRQGDRSNNFIRRDKVTMNCYSEWYRFPKKWKAAWYLSNLFHLVACKTKQLLFKVRVYWFIVAEVSEDRSALRFQNTWIQLQQLCENNISARCLWPRSRFQVSFVRMPFLHCSAEPPWQPYAVSLQSLKTSWYPFLNGSLHRSYPTE